MSDSSLNPTYLEVPVPSAESWEPHTNLIDFIYPDASNMSFTLAMIDEFRRNQLFTNTIFSVQIGAAVVIIFVMLCITHADKRKTPVFIVNLVNLLLVAVRGILFDDYFMGPLARTYTTFAWDTSDVPTSALIKSIISSILSLLLMIGTQISLLLQIRICYALNPRSRTRILVTCGSIGALATVAYLSLGIYAIKLQEKPPDIRITKWAKPLVNSLVALSIVVYSGMFSWRMFQSVRNRRRMGFTGLGSLESLLISGFQCLVFPAIFCVIENFVKFGGSASLAQATVAFLLPISHLWATNVQANSKLSMARIEQLQERKLLRERIAHMLKSYCQHCLGSFRCLVLFVEMSYLKICSGCLTRFRSRFRSRQDGCDITSRSRKIEFKSCTAERPSMAGDSLNTSRVSPNDISGFGKDIEAGRGI
ncbi:Proteasome subunit beta type-5 [Orbilia ellipsospora]|uniref:Proteasome subunit beta type-5 n=1 Tax=Orbilia ellipsospora TaxID=2528407 RepID=A0AAV9WVD8_9PEZI